MIDVLQQAVQECVAECKAHGEDCVQTCDTLDRQFPDLPASMIEEMISRAFNDISPEQWARIFAAKMPVKEAAIRIRARFPDLPARRMSNALIDGYKDKAPVTPEHLMLALAAARYTPVETAPTVKAEFPSVARFEMLLLLNHGYPQSDRGQVRSSMAAAGYSSAPEWVELERINTWVQQFGLAAIDDQLYVVGGQRNLARALNQSYRLDKGWSYRQEMPTARRQLCVGAIGGKLYVVGGTDGNGGDRPLPVNEEYDPQIDSWRPKAQPPVPTINAAAVVVDNKLYVIGGQSGPDWSPGTFAYDPATDQWTAKAPSPIPWPFSVASVINGRIHLLSSLYDPTAPLRHMVYDPAADTWEMKQELFGEDTDRTNFAAAAVDEKLYVIGGSRFVRDAPWDPATEVKLATCYVYDPATDAWSSALALPEPRTNCAAVAIARLGLLVVVGGKGDPLGLMIG